MPFAENHGARLHWDARGEGAPILLIMGHRYSSALWYPLIPALAAEQRVIWFDNRGTGQSDTTRGVTLQDFADDALAVMSAAGVERAHVFGVSMGGGIAQQVAITAPQRVISLILGCTAMKTADMRSMPAFMRVLYHLPPWALKAILPKPADGHGYGTAAPADRVAADQAVLAKDKSTIPGVIAQAKAIADYTTTREAVAALTMPALILYGDEDTLVPFSRGEILAETLSNSRLVKLEGAGHNFIVARLEETTEALLGFLREVDHGAMGSKA